MRSIKNHYFDLIGFDRNSLNYEAGFAFNLEGRSYNKNYIYFNSTTYRGKIYKLNLNTEVVEVNRIEDWLKNTIKSMKFEYSFTVNNENLKSIKDFLSRLNKA